MLLNSRLARRCVDQKEILSRLLRSKGFPAPENQVFSASDIERAWLWAKPILPIVLKPSNSSKGKLIYVKITQYEDFVHAFESISQEYPEVLIEQFVEGEEHRFAYINGRIEAVTKRLPAHVVGNGHNSIKELVAQKNKKREESNNPIHVKIELNKKSVKILEQQGFTPESIPSKEETVYLLNNSNVSTGGDAVDVTSSIDDAIKNEVAEAVKSIRGLKVVGVDVIINRNEFFILEINSNPMLSMHHYPWKGDPVNVSKILLEAIFSN